MSNIHEMVAVAGSFDKAEEMAKNLIKEHGPEYLLDLGLLYSWRGKIDESWDCIQKATEAYPDDDRVAYNRGWHYLLRGKFWEGYELMSRARDAGIWSLNAISDKPMWRGEDIKGKHVLFYAEAGYGDEITYIRFAREISKLGAHVTVIASKDLVPLFARIPDLSCVTSRKPGLGDASGNPDIAQGIYHDYYVLSLGSPIPLKTEWSDIHGEPYIVPRSAYVQKFSRYINSDKLKIGVRWLGQSGPDYANRVFPREQFFEAVTQEHVQLYSLQKDHSADGLPKHIVDLEPVLDNWEDTAAAIANLDLVISSCTSVAHLAAAMGKPTWIVVPVMMYVTWCHSGDTTPWYDSAVLFRQKVYDDWSSPFNRIRERLKTFERKSPASFFYNPEFYDVKDMEEAKWVIVDPERWETETPHLVKQIGEFISPMEDDVILDYGCGAGRLSKELIDQYGCHVVGVDISESMHKLAIEYVNSPKFSVYFPEEFEQMVSQGFVVDHIVAVWALQHFLEVDKIIKNLNKVLKPYGLLYVVNAIKSLIPTKIANAGGWSHDETNVHELLLEEFIELDYGKLTEEVASQFDIDRSYVSKLRKRDLNEA